MMERSFIETKIIADDTGTISGLAWPFGTPDRIGDVIEKGAFAGSALPLPMLFGHDLSDPVGTWNEAKETDQGLELKGQMLTDSVARAREVNALVKAGAVRGLSIGFETLSSSPRQGGGRTINSLRLIEVSLVTVPMHPGAKITSAKSGIEAIQLAETIKRASAQLQRK